MTKVKKLWSFAKLNRIQIKTNANTRWIVKNVWKIWENAFGAKVMVVVAEIHYVKI